MATQLLNLPVNIPWKLIATSQDMMDTNFGDKDFPLEWRSSLAISAFEPKPEDLPEDLCEEVITYLKITCSITGYQPTKTETERAFTEFSDVEFAGGEELTPVERQLERQERLDRILRDYFACYGVLLNVAVFPFGEKRVERIGVNFGDTTRFQPGTEPPNPLRLDPENLSFRAADEQNNDQPNNRIVDIFPAGGDGNGELDLFRSMEVTFPAALRVEAKVVYQADLDTRQNPVKMTAHKADGSLESASAEFEGQRVFDLAIDGRGEAIEKVVFTSPDAQVSLLEFAYHTEVEEPCEPKVFNPTQLEKFPRIIDFEPKKRDLYQSATEDGEILTASVSEVKTDKSFTHTETSETGVSVEGTIGKAAPQTGGLFGSITGSFSRKWGETDQDSLSIQTDASRERRERHATTTNLSQMYNLLTGYHSGTNRAVFLMLPRPHVLQPTDHRTFVQGLRYIEGVQDFFLVVVRPKEVAGLRIEAQLETGHFPEDVQADPVPVEYEERHEDFVLTVDKRIDDDIENLISSKYTVESGWVIDRREKRKGERGIPTANGWDSGHPGMKDLSATPNDLVGGTLRLAGVLVASTYNYQPVSDSTVQVSGRLTPDDVIFFREFRVFTRSERPLPTNAQPRVGLDRLLITCRSLSACFKSGECPEVVVPQIPSTLPTVCIVDERKIFVDAALSMQDETAPTHLTTPKLAFAEDGRIVISEVQPTLLTPDANHPTRQPAMKELLRKVESAMTNSGRLPTRRPFGEVGFLESDYFKDRLKEQLSQELLDTKLADVRVPPDAQGLLKAVRDVFDPPPPRRRAPRPSQATVKDALEPDLASFARLMKEKNMSTQDAVRARFMLLKAKPPGIR